MLNVNQADALIEEMKTLIRDLQNQIALQQRKIEDLEFEIESTNNKFYDC